MVKDFVFTGDRLEEELQVQIILGICNERVQRQLLSEADFDYKRTLQIVQTAEQVKRQASILISSQQEVSKLEECSASEEELFNHRSSRPSIQIDLSLNDSPAQIELDTGAAKTLIRRKLTDHHGRNHPKSN